MEIVLRADGLHTAHNPFSEIPEGALAIAENILFRRRSVIEPRNGFNNVGTRLGAFHSLGRYQGNTIGNHATTELARHDGTSWTAYSGGHTAINSDGDGKMRFAEASGCLYFTTVNGVERLDDAGGTPLLAGHVRAYSFDWDVPVPTTVNDVPRLDGSSGFLNEDYQVAYRFTIGFRDANDNVLIGSPSGRIVVSNNSVFNGSGASRNVVVRCLLPKLPGSTNDLTTSYFVQLWRSKQVSVNSVNFPSDELYQCHEVFVTSGDITAGYLEITDICPDSMLGDAAYFNPTQEGIVNINDMPPLAYDISYFNNRMMYARTLDFHRFFIDLLGVGAPDGLVEDDTITVNGDEFTAKAVPIFSDEFRVQTGFSPSLDIEHTAMALVAAINKASTSVYALYLSGPDDAPGKIMIVQRTQLGGLFFVKSSRSTCWNPPVESTDTLAGQSEAENGENIVYYSKPLQPESVPRLNKLRIGSRDSAISRIFPLRNTMYVFKNEGLWKIVPDGLSFVVEEVDSTVRLLAPNSVAVVNNKLFALCQNGVQEITENGVFPVSHVIDDLITGHIEDAGDTAVVRNTFAVGHEKLNCYMLFMPIAPFAPPSPTGKSAEVAYVYNARLKVWSKWTDVVYNCGVYDNDEMKLILGETVFVLSGNLAVESEDYIEADDTGIPVRFGWTVHFGGDPTVSKRFIESLLVAESAMSHMVTASYHNELDPTPEAITSIGLNRAHYRFAVPRSKARCSRLSLIFSYNTLEGTPPSILGARVMFEEAGVNSNK